MKIKFLQGMFTLELLKKQSMALKAKLDLFVVVICMSLCLFVVVICMTSVYEATLTNLVYLVNQAILAYLVYQAIFAVYQAILVCLAYQAILVYQVILTYLVYQAILAYMYISEVPQAYPLLVKKTMAATIPFTMTILT